MGALHGFRWKESWDETHGDSKEILGEGSKQFWKLTHTSCQTNVYIYKMISYKNKIIYHISIAYVSINIYIYPNLYFYIQIIYILR